MAEEPAANPSASVTRTTRQIGVPSSATSQTPGKAKLPNRAVQPVSGTRVASPAGFYIERTAAVARVPALESANFSAAGRVMPENGTSPDLYPDEYLLDGGDRGYPIHRNEEQRLGIETEDTIAEYKDDEGKPHVKASNRVAVYAPRFGAVVSISGSTSDAQYNKVAGNVTAQRTGGMKGRDMLLAQSQPVEVGKFQSRLRGTGIRTEQSQREMDRSQNRAIGSQIDQLHEDRTALHASESVHTLALNLATGLQYAQVWTRKESPTIEAKVVSAHESKTVWRAAEYVRAKGEGRKSEIRIFKTADTGVALPGEVVTFTIHYLNTGDRNLLDVVIVDNLTPRLEFLPDSVDSDRPMTLITEDNHEGSLLVRFEHDGPFPARSQGKITFQAKVR